MSWKESEQYNRGSFGTKDVDMAVVLNDIEYQWSIKKICLSAKPYKIRVRGIGDEDITSICPFSFVHSIARRHVEKLFQRICPCTHQM